MMKLEQNGQSFDLITNDGQVMSLVRRAGMRSEEFVGYARLFSAANELLGALEARLELEWDIRRFSSDQREHRTWLIEANEANERCREAVAKARGGA
jgi:hypothetical protein